ncbi:armadillo repeat-containing protein 2 [Trichomycterus rosablanca]|uniref:armadillo repeat-containing protein 2 n=1 Tax=Trichomycterus rosablanca TaxID=2290929 RepID=UPI002F358D93
MVSMEHTREKKDPYHRNCASRRQTSAEIVTEARNSLKTLGTRRPFTPREEQRQLFGAASSRTRDGRPPSTFSLHAQNFEAPDSRPNSGTRLSPLDHKPSLPVSPDEDCSDKGSITPKPPAERMVQSNSGGGRARQRRATSLTRLHPVTQQSDDAQPHCNNEPPKNKESSQKVKTDPVHVKSDYEKGRPEDSSETPTRTPTKHRPSRTDGSYTKGTGSQHTDAECGHGDTTAGDPMDVLWNSEVLPVLQMFETAAPGRGESKESLQSLCDACERLYNVLSVKGMLGRRFKKRSSILRALFRLIDLGSDQLNVTLAKVVLALNVSGNNLLNICKLVFKISRSPSNDILFQNSSITDSLLWLLQGEDVVSGGETVLYCMGSLKLLSGNSTLARLLLDKDFIRILIELAHKLVPSTVHDGLPKNDHTSVRHGQHVIAGHILVQLTASLRNLADLPESRSSFLSNNVFSTLCEVMDGHQDDQDICLNVARIFSKLSSYAECCYVLAETPSCYRLFLALLSKHSRKQDLVVRLLFTLGNLAARSNEARQRVYEEDGALDVLLDLFQIYMQGVRNPLDSQDLSHSEEDVLIKLIRVLANLSIHSTVGVALAANSQCVELLLEVMELRSVEDSTELVVNATATINNLSYYQTDGSVVRTQHERISELLLKLLLSTHMDAVLEATRVFGNLSHIEEVRHFIIKNKAHQFVLALLDSKNPEVCFSACGVLMNLSADPDNRTIVNQEGAVNKLIECLRDFGPQDWILAAVVCQTLWNCTEDGEKRDPQELLDILLLFSDHKALQWPSDEEIKAYQEACWELEFLPVAQRLKKRLKSHKNLLDLTSEFS